MGRHTVTFHVNMFTDILVLIRTSYTLDLELNRSIGRISRPALPGAQLPATSLGSREFQQVSQPPSQLARPPSVLENAAPEVPACDVSIASVNEFGTRSSAQPTPTGLLDMATSDPPARVASISSTEFDEFFLRLCKQLERDTRKVSHKAIQVDDSFKRMP